MTGSETTFGSAPSHVAVLTLTYGDRTPLLAQMVRGVAHQGVRRVWVLGNGLSPEVAAATEALAAEMASHGVTLTVLKEAENQGSAPGYGRLLSAATADPNVAAVWFLDDDNVPDAGCLDRLLVAQAQTGGAVTALRHDRAYMLQAVAAGQARPPAPGEAFGKDLRRLAGRAVAKLGRKLGMGRTQTGQDKAPARVASDASLSAVPMPRVPYGGLLVPTALTRQVSPPRADFVLYADDYEYTERLAVTEGLAAVPGAFITDLEASWNATQSAAASDTPKREPSQSAKLAAMTPDFRMFYALRNALYLDRHRVRGGAWLWFVVNLIWLLGETGARALIRGRMGNLRCLWNATCAGLAGHLGRDPRYPLP